MRRRRTQARKRGTAIIEATLLVPWIFFIFVGVLDFGFYTYAAICTQNAALAAAAWTSSNGVLVNNLYACQAALPELNQLPNTRTLSGCATSPGGVSASQPVAVSARILDSSTTPPCADCATCPVCRSSQVSVTYQTIPMIPIPGVMMGQLQLTRVAEMRIAP
jgi:Flp pilus assembly protein TadG